jgi:hypothetical protein
MFEVIVALLTVLSVGIFAAHAVDAVRSRKRGHLAANPWLSFLGGGGPSLVPQALGPQLTMSVPGFLQTDVCADGLVLGVTHTDPFTERQPQCPVIEPPYTS